MKATNLCAVLLLTSSFAATSEVSASTEHPFGRLNPNAPPETEQWGQLAGVWDCTIEGRDAEGNTRRSKATWTWAYILDGYAVQDIYVGSPTEGRPTFHGTGLRVYNRSRKKWEITWTSNTSPDDRKMTTYEATYEDGAIVMRYADPSRDPSWRTVFFEVREDSFEWRNEPSQQTMHCRRVRDR